MISNILKIDFKLKRISNDEVTDASCGLIRFNNYALFYLCVHRLSICLVSFFYSSINFTRFLFNQSSSLLSSISLSFSHSRAHSRWRFDDNEERTCAAERQKETAGGSGRGTWSRVKWTPVPTGAQQERRRAGRVDKTGGPHRRDSRDRELALGAHGARAREPLIHEFSLRRLRRVSGACRRRRMRSRATEGCPSRNTRSRLTRQFDRIASCLICELVKPVIVGGGRTYYYATTP